MIGHGQTFHNLPIPLTKPGVQGILCRTNNLVLNAFLYRYCIYYILLYTPLPCISITYTCIYTFVPFEVDFISGRIGCGL